MWDVRTTFDIVFFVPDKTLDIIAMSDQKMLFKPRKFGNADSAVFTRKSFLADSTTEAPSFSGLTNIGVYSGVELTKNDKYCVSKLPACPPILSSNNMDESNELLNGYADNTSKCALVIGDRAINVWPYKSTDDVPLTFEFPLQDENQGLQLAILTLPTPGSTIDPGLVIINSISGYVRFYESLQHAPALGLINSKLIETTVPILLAQGECITVAENVEPAGVVVATSWKRVVLILLRDFKGAPKLSLVELSAPSKSFRLLSGWFKRGDGDHLSDEIVSIKTGRITGNGLAQEIIIQDAAGAFKKVFFQFSATGSPHINHRRTLNFNLPSYLENNIDGFIPGAVIDVKYLDLWPLRPQVDLDSDSQLLDDLYTALICVQSSIHGTDEKRLLLVTMKINDSGVLVYGSHQLPQVDTSLSDSLVVKPRLFIPRPGATAFVVVGNSIILTDMNTKFLTKASTATFLYFKPKWEDTVNLKSSVEVIGLGYEDKATESNPSLVLITRDYGVLRVERFTDNTDDVKENIEDTSIDPTDPVYLLKSRIQQAIYYHDSSVVDFNVSEGYADEVISTATKSVISEILDSSSPYLPSIFASTRESFIVRINLMHQLIAFALENFDNSWFIVPDIVYALEKLAVSEGLWNLVDVETPEASLLKEKLVYFMQSKSFVNTSTNQDTLRTFFTKNVDNILDVLTGFIEFLHQNDFSTAVILKILETTLYEAVFVNEERYVSQITQKTAVKNWIFDSKLLIVAEDIYSNAYCSSNKEFEYLSSTQSRMQLVHLTEALYYLVNSAVKYMKESNDDQLTEYQKWYTNRKSQWVNAMLKHGLVNDALRITEKYHDFLSVAAVLEKERDQTSPEYIEEHIRHFMEKYGYEFAAELFSYYLEADKIHRLILDCGSFQEYLEMFFKKNHTKSAKVAWIHYLLVSKFEEAAKGLMTLSNSKEMDNQENRELNLSLAKLTAIAAKFKDPVSPNIMALEEIAIESENNLVVTRIQNNLFHLVSLFLQGQKSLITLDWFMKNFVNPAIPPDAVKQEILSYFERFVNEHPLEKEQLVTLLTIIKPVNQFKQVFADALMVAALIGNDSTFQQQASEVWLKLLTTTDDWKSICLTSETTDMVNKTRIRETTLFYTISLVSFNKDIMQMLERVLQSVEEGNDIERSPLLQTLYDLVHNNNLASWVDSIKAEVRQN